MKNFEKDFEKKKFHIENNIHVIMKNEKGHSEWDSDQAFNVHTILNLFSKSNQVSPNVDINLDNLIELYKVPCDN